MMADFVAPENRPLPTRHDWRAAFLCGWFAGIIWGLILGWWLL
jgi:hypothetical protein